MQTVQVGVRSRSTVSASHWVDISEMCVRELFSQSLALWGVSEHPTVAALCLRCGFSASSLFRPVSSLEL